MYQVLYRKWRPKTFEDVAGQEHITTTLKNEVIENRLTHAYLFTGSRGTGKTTCAKILAKAANCLDPQNGDPCGVCEICKGIENGSVLDVVEMDAASNRKIENIRDIIDEVQFKPNRARFRVYIVDEVHMLTTEAFNALLKTLEEPPEHVIFILATTEVHKLPQTILSRCQRFDFHRIPPQAIADRVLYVAGQEKVQLSEAAALLIAGVADGFVKDTSIPEIARDMVGHEVHTGLKSTSNTFGEEVLRLEHLTQEPYFRDVSLSVRAGEVLGVTGLLGDGRSELFRAVFGAQGKVQGSVYMHGKPVSITSTQQALKLGIGYLPRNRKENGIIKDMNILENGSIVTLPRLTKFGLIQAKEQLFEFRKQRKDLHIKMEKEKDSITSLSGGNQQKVVLAKWLSANPSLLILDNPTQGVDVGAKEEIYEIILKLAAQGVAVVVLCSEAQEIIRLCDRALVMYHGSVRAEVSGETMNEHEMMRLATGG